MPLSVTKVFDKLHPAGWTDLRTYRLAVLAGAASLAIVGGIVFIAELPPWIMAPVALIGFILLFLLTIRRLRDAGLSAWIVLLALFPFGISIDVGTVEVIGLTLRFIDFAAVIKIAPFLLGLAWPSQPVERRVL